MQTINQIAPTESDKRVLTYTWDFWARPKQLAPKNDWQYWMLLAGRGFGKTRAEVEWMRFKAEKMPGSRGFICGRTAGDVRDTLVEGESGILAISPLWFMPRYESSKRRLIWPNGTQATLFSAEKPDQARGPSHHWGIADELASWQYAKETWDNLMFGLRLGENPQAVIATTPRPIPIIKELVSDDATAVTTGSTYENRANLAPAFLETIVKRYEGTRLGRQELYAELLWDVPGALWTHEILERNRVKEHPSLYRIVVAIDPAVSLSEDSSETGIVVAGIDENEEGYVLDDVTVKGSPAQWAAVAVKAYDKWNADRIVAEVNNGGDMIEFTVRTAAKDLAERGERETRNVSFRQVRATKGKHTRAEPVSALYEQGHIHHVGSFPELEDQMCVWVPGEDSPDRMDALVWAFNELMHLEMTLEYGVDIWQ